MASTADDLRRILTHHGLAPPVPGSQLRPAGQSGEVAQGQLDFVRISQKLAFPMHHQRTVATMKLAAAPAGATWPDTPQERCLQPAVRCAGRGQILNALVSGSVPAFCKLTLECTRSSMPQVRRPALANLVLRSVPPVAVSQRAAVLQDLAPGLVAFDFGQEVPAEGWTCTGRWNTLHGQVAGRVCVLRG